MLDTFDSWRRRDDPKMNAGLMIELAAESTRDAEIARAVRDKDRAFESNIAALVRRVASSRGVKLTVAAARSRAMVLQCLVEGLACAWCAIRNCGAPRSSPRSRPWSPCS